MNIRYKDSLGRQKRPDGAAVPRASNLNAMSFEKNQGTSSLNSASASRPGAAFVAADISRPSRKVVFVRIVAFGEQRWCEGSPEHNHEACDVKPVQWRRRAILRLGWLPRACWIPGQMSTNFATGSSRTTSRLAHWFGARVATDCRSRYAQPLGSAQDGGPSGDTGARTGDARI